jgi:hypothetical protein
MRICSTARTAVIVMIGALMIVGSAAADPLTYRYSGWSVGSDVDANEDGFTASVLTSKGFSTWGPITANGLTEGRPVSEYCDGKSNGTESTSGRGTIVIRTNKGDLLYARVTDGARCFDQTTSTIHITANWEITGGSGRFENATGFAIDTGTIFCLGGNHCALQGLAEGDILLNK